MNLPAIFRWTLELLFGRKKCSCNEISEVHLVACRHCQPVTCNLHDCLKRSIDLFHTQLWTELPVALKRATGFEQAALALADIAEVDLQML